MLIINDFATIRQMEGQGAISRPLAVHLAKKTERLRAALEPDCEPDDFKLGPQHGIICIMEPGDKDLSGAGITQPLSEIMFEWISRLQVEDLSYYVVYIMVNNDNILQVYLPDQYLESAVRTWINEQPVEEESDDDEANTYEEPF